MDYYWQVIDIHKSGLSDKIKRKYFKAVAERVVLYGCTTWTNKVIGEKARWEQHKDAVCCIEVAPYKSAAVEPLSVHLIKYSRRERYAGHCWRSKDELISDFLLWTPTYEHTSVSWPAKSYIQQLRVNTRCRVEDLTQEWPIGIDR